MRTEHEKHKYIILPNTNNTKPFCEPRGNRVLDRKSGETGAHPDNAKRYTPESVETETMVFYDHDKLE